MKVSIEHSKRSNEDISDFQVKKRRKIKNKEKIAYENLKNRKLKKIQKKQIHKEKNEVNDIITSDTDSSISVDMVENEKKKNDDQSTISDNSVKFASALSKIISSTVDSFDKNDPVLSYSKIDMAKKIEEKSIENKAKMLISIEKKKEKEKGRIKDIIPIDDNEARKALEYEKSLRKIAQKGVINLFNTIQAVQTKAKKVSKEMKKKKLMSTQKREKEVAKMSKQEFLDMIRKTNKT
ncbi:uncharacterized protein T551_00477 [Pneumocystis jirovecii RU7]|uniref:Ribosomal RNA-processing protein 15 n=1 Tax=Pneumocystis jirovecii (strain RU7) TaxID=1408657 RepID=A0A0W4ZVK2_PNEJ7|nr:uncharacterized protein T551_00477 [Pneumocystis jirovecii RU7]KTW32387.1 hypothetical protein T551_00477 [Pneumocystis jirovecii RU7]